MPMYAGMERPLDDDDDELEPPDDHVDHTGRHQVHWVAPVVLVVVVVVVVIVVVVVVVVGGEQARAPSKLLTSKPGQAS